MIRKAHLNFQLRWSKWIIIWFEIVHLILLGACMTDIYLIPDTMQFVIQVTLLSTLHKFLQIRYLPLDQNSTVHLCRIQGPVGDSNECYLQKFMMNRPFFKIWYYQLNLYWWVNSISNYWLKWLQIPTFLCSSGVSSPWQPSSNSGCNV